jgi:hypothetical protein
MRRLILSSVVLGVSGLALWACATAAVLDTSTETPETGPIDNDSGKSADAGCPQYNTDTDPNHCGSCTIKCTALQVCTGGVCKAACDAPTTKCTSDAGGSCVDLSKDPANCGMCNNKCPVVDAGSLPLDNGNDSGIPVPEGGAFDAGIPPSVGTPSCASNTCGVNCPPQTTLCSDKICYDTQNNHDHCGNCSTACAQDTEWCTAGHCCASGTSYCNGACVDVLSDKNNCGSCGNVCPMNAPVCTNGQCSNMRPECSSATNINGDKWYVNNPGCNSNCCENTLTNNTWYRFTGTYKSLVTADPGPNKCGTAATGWLKGVLPANGQTASLTECYDWSGNTCNWSNAVQVTNCGSYYVYQLQNPPACNLAYCMQ